MKISYHHLTAIPLASLLAALLATGCHSTSIKTTWKAPDFNGGPVRKLAVLAVADEGLVRGGFENRFVNQLSRGGQDAFTTYKTLPLADIKANKEATAAALRQAGADTILILRLVGSSTRFVHVRQTHEAYLPTVAGMATDGWYDCYSVAFTDLSVVHDSTRQDVLLDSSLFDLNSGKRIWSCVTDTVVKEDVDRLELADAFVAKVVTALRKDRIVR
jgi:hypothetical protein